MNNLTDKLHAIWLRFNEVNDLLMQPEIASDSARFVLLNREFKSLNDIMQVRDDYMDKLARYGEAKGMLKTEKDPDMKAMAQEEYDELAPAIQDLEEFIRVMLIPKDPEDEKDAVLEVRAGIGGDEAGIFSGEIVRMYLRFIEDKGWKAEWISSTDATHGGFKEATIQLRGEGVYGIMKYESGVHRVQRVPSTESQGRVHTSAVTVAVMPEADELDVVIDNKDIRKDTFRSSGAGGQHVNKTESGVRLTHAPTGIVVECQDGRSQHKNYAQALTVLRSRIWDKARSERDAVIAAKRKSLVSTGDRSAKIRTYNYPQSRVTDHRIGLTLYNLPEIINGAIAPLIDALQLAENAERLKEGSE